MLTFMDYWAAFCVVVGAVAAGWACALCVVDDTPWDDTADEDGPS